MSYDYLMFQNPGWKPQWLKRLLLFRAGNNFGSMGIPEELKAGINSLFPHITWNQAKVWRRRSTAPGGQTDPNAPVWFGLGRRESVSHRRERHGVAFGGFKG